MTIAEAIVEEGAALEAVDPLDLPPLYDSVDPDALTACLDSTGSSSRIQFTYCLYTVVLDGDGSLRIDESEPAGTG